MLTIKLKRVGRKNDPHFRMVVTPHNKPKKVLEYLGSYDPIAKKGLFEKERILHWMKNGAHVSDTAHNLMVKHAVLTTPKRKINITIKKKEGEAEKK